MSSKVTSLEITGRATQGEAAQDANDLVRYAEFLQATSGVRSHQHTASDITDFDSEVGDKVEAMLVATVDLYFVEAGGALSGVVRVRPGGALRKGGDGLYIALGTGSDEAAAGDHTHDEFHDPVTSGVSNSIDMALDDQQLSLEVRLAQLSGLTVTASGLRINFGTGENEAARGNHTHDDLHTPVTVSSTATLLLGIDANQVLSGVVRLDSNPGSDRAALSQGANGIYLALGTGANQAAAGNHGHTVATTLADGFMGTQHVALLDLLEPLLSGAQLITTSTPSLDLGYDEDNRILSGIVRRDLNPGDDRAVIGEGVSGLFIQLGTGANEVAAGDHTHAPPSGTGFRHVTAGVEDSTAKLLENADVAADAGIAESKLALSFETHSNANDPSATEKAALSGTGGTPGAGNPYVTSSDPRVERDGIRIVLDGYGAELSVGAQEFFVMPFSGVVTGWDIVGDQSGSLVVDVWKDSYANFPPDSGDSIAGTEKPTLSSEQINQDLNLTTWTTALGTGDVLVFNVDSVTTIEKASVQLRIKRT